MPKFYVTLTVPITAHTPELAAEKFREYFRIDRQLKVTSADGEKINDHWSGPDDTVWIEPPFTEGA